MTFIDRYGHVKYTSRSHKKYRPIVDDACEICGRTVQDMKEEFIRDAFWNYTELDLNRRARLIIEHCHVHGYIRGYACNGCNVSLGSGYFPILESNMIHIVNKYYANCPRCSVATYNGEIFIHRTAHRY